MFKLDSIENGTIFITSDVKMEPRTIVQDFIVGDENPESRLFIKSTNLAGIYTYGAEQLRDSYFGHSAGYIWASRCGVMNKVFNTALHECAIRTSNQLTYTSCAIDLVVYESFLNENGYSIDWEHPFEDDTDKTYKLISNETNS